MNHHDHLLALAAFWKLGAKAEATLQLLPEARRLEMLAAVSGEARKDPVASLRKLAEKEFRRTNAWGRRRFGAGWDRVDPRVRARLIARDRG